MTQETITYKATGVTTVDLLARESNVLRGRGPDAINSTPVLDLKPA